MKLNEVQILFYAAAAAFCFVQLLPRVRLTARKPFNCLTCMTGWVALVLTIISGYDWPWWILLMLAGWFVGAVMSGIIMRYL